MKRWTSDLRLATRILLSVLAVAVLASSVRAADPLNESAIARTRRRTPVVDVFEHCRAAVVNITSTKRIEVMRGGNPFADIFEFEPMIPRRQYAEAQSLGSGFVVHEEGYIVTNAHVVAQTFRRKIVFADKTELDADIVAVDPDNDLAVLKVDAHKPLLYLAMGRSDDLMIGESVVAIGNPLGYQHTCTSGIISALNRELAFPNGVVYRGLIQTDASINPGNSGGPLLNINGELIGINTAIRGDAQNIGFAIPVDRLRAKLPVYLDVERLRMIRVGMHLGDSTTLPGSNRSGVTIVRVDADSPAAKAGLQKGDVVLSIGSRTTPTFLDAFSVLNHARTTEPIDLTVSRDGNQARHSLTMSVFSRRFGTRLMASRFGLSVREMSSRDQEALGVDQPIGLVVTRVQPGSQAEDAGLESGDIITKLGSVPIPSADVAGLVLESYFSRGEQIPVAVIRYDGGRVYSGVVRLKAN